MAVLQCGGCDRLISVSIVPGGNPVALADPQRWSVVRRVCEDCRKSFCDRCAPSVRTPCPSCGGDFEGGAGASLAAADARAAAEFSGAVAGAQRWLTAAVILAAVWIFAHAVSTSGFRIVFYVLAAVVGTTGLWKYLKALEKPVWVFFVACCGVLVPWVNLGVLFLFRVMTGMSLRSAAANAAQAMEVAGEPAQAAPAAAKPQAPAAQAQATAAFATAAASAPVAPHDPLDAFAARLAAHWKTPLRPYSNVDFGRGRNPEARSFIVPRQRAIPVVTAIRKAGVPPGLIVFEGTGRWLGDEKHGDDVEIVVARGQSTFDAIRVANTDPVNHGLSAGDVVARLERYHRSFGVEVFQADTESVVFRLSKLPSSLDRFVKDLQDFCPDSIEEGMEEEFARGIVESQGWVALWWD